MVPDGMRRGYGGDIKPAVLLGDQLHLSIRLSLRQGVVVGVVGLVCVCVCVCVCGSGGVGG